MQFSAKCNAMAAVWRIASVSIITAGLAWGTHVGPVIGNNPAITNNVNFQAVLGQNWAPPTQDITADPSAQAWLKNLIGFDPAVGNPIPNGVGASIKERANLGEPNDAGPAWYMWTETITSPDWAWLDGGAQTFPNGQNVTGALSNNDKTITFTFPAVAAGAGNFLVTEKRIQCVNANGCAVPTANAPIKVYEFPTMVPEPGTCALIIAALIPLARWGRRRVA